MKRNSLIFMLMALVTAAPALACEYRAGETKFVDYAHCAYGADAVVVVDLPENAAWDRCVYRTQAFVPPKLLAVTREESGREEAGINCRGAIGNPCYLMKSVCDACLKAQQEG